MGWEYALGEASARLTHKANKDWKYFVRDKKVGSRAAILETFGKEGFELVSVSTLTSSTQRKGFGGAVFTETVKELFYFKRPLEE